MLFTFPSRYWFTIGCRDVFSLGRWSSRIHARFHVPHATWVPDPRRSSVFCLRGFHPLWPRFPTPSTRHRLCNFLRPLQCSPVWSHNPERACGLQAWRLVRFGLFPVRSSLLGESRLLSLPEGTEIFQFPSFTVTHLCIQCALTGITRFGFPHSEIHGSTFAYQLPVAYRRYPRPSSSLGTKASTVCPYIT